MKKICFTPLASRLMWMLTMLSLVAACKTEDEPAPKKKKDLLIKTWEVKEVLYNGTTLPNNTAVGTKYEFRKDGSYTEFKGSQSWNGKWEMNDAADKITFNKGTQDALEFKLLKLEKENLYMEFSGYNEKNDQVTIEFRLKP